MISKLILWYLRHVPVEKKKYLIEKYLSRFLPAKEIKENYINPHGITFWIDNRDFVMNKIYLRGVYERNTIRHVVKLIKGKSGHMIDCGANIGLYSMYLSKYAPAATIHSFEPIPRTLEIFKKNISLNHAKNIVVNPIGLSNRVGELDLFVVEEENYGRTSENNVNDSQNKITIPIDTLDNYCSRNNIHELSFIKVDIEGGELNFFKGGEKIIRQSPDIIMVVEINECAYSSGYSPQDLFDYICNFGFVPFRERDYPFAMRQMESLGTYRGNVIFLKQKKS